MDALKIAFETVIIGALALPWVLLALDLFLQPKEDALLKALDFAKEKQLYGIAAVLLFAVAYFMGAAISRLAGDFFNDDDLGIQATEDAIRSQVYGDSRKEWAAKLNIQPEKELRTPGAFCRRVFPDHAADDASNELTKQVFDLQESALLLLGVDKTGRLQHMHQQLLILRGAALNGIILSLLFLFGFCAKQQESGKRILLGLCSALLVLALRALVRHICSLGPQQALIDPPLMELTLFAVIGTGFALHRKEISADRSYGVGCLVSVMLTFFAYAGWWWTEVIYDGLVINMFSAQSQGLLR
jgi:hypothetical protein